MDSGGLSHNSPWLLVTSPESQPEGLPSPGVPAQGPQPEGPSPGATARGSQPEGPSPKGLSPSASDQHWWQGCPGDRRALLSISPVVPTLLQGCPTLFLRSLEPPQSRDQCSWAGFRSQLSTFGLLHRNKAPHGSLSLVNNPQLIPSCRSCTEQPQPSPVTGRTEQAKHPKPTPNYTNYPSRSRQAILTSSPGSALPRG